MYCYSEACQKALQSRQARFWKSTNSQATEDQEHHAESECWLLCAVSTNVEQGVQSSLFTLMQPCSTVTAAWGWGNTSQSTRRSQVTGMMISRLDARENRSTIQQPFAGAAPPREAPSAQDGDTSELLGESQLTRATEPRHTATFQCALKHTCQQRTQGYKVFIPQEMGKSAKRLLLVCF